MPIKLNANDCKVMAALRDIYNHLNASDPTANPWVSTREVAEQCDINIYRARYSLIKLAILGMAIQQPGKKRNRNWKPIIKAAQ